MNKKLEELSYELVPGVGKAATTAGELVRAVNRIDYRWYNDGDVVGVGYGKETCNAPLRFLGEWVDMHTSMNLRRLKNVISKLQKIGILGFIPDEEYEQLLEELDAALVEMLEQYPELKSEDNGLDMWDWTNRLEDRDDTEDEEF